LPDSLRPAWLRIGADFVTIEILARPGSQRRGLLRVEPGGLVIGLASAAVKGRANNELIALIADIAGVARTNVSILRGASARLKVVRIECNKVRVAPKEVADRIMRWASAKTGSSG
jgi:uncharacterized protein YggU (UPF0235/DUF167 family)